MFRVCSITAPLYLFTKIRNVIMNFMSEGNPLKDEDLVSLVYLPDDDEKYLFAVFINDDDEIEELIIEDLLVRKTYRLRTTCKNLERIINIIKEKYNQYTMRLFAKFVSELPNYAYIQYYKYHGVDGIVVLRRPRERTFSVVGVRPSKTNILDVLYHLEQRVDVIRRGKGIFEIDDITLEEDIPKRCVKELKDIRYLTPTFFFGFAEC